ncbi:MAG: DUF5011 domain-containing protein [Candidatus Hydrogenedens sp.]|nr:DUF5011 domain-containing protein [Candidatus Hydrogenedens sp.]
MKHHGGKGFVAFTLAAITAIFSAWAHAQTTVGGTIASDTTWTLAGSPYNATSNVVVSAGVTLTIEAGVTVRFNADRAMTINGQLIARGTAQAPIHFTSTSNWGYILFNDASTDATFDGNNNYLSGSVLEYCTIERGGNLDIVQNGALRLLKAYPFIKNVDFQFNKASAIYLSGASKKLRLYNCTFADNTGTAQRTESYGLLQVEESPVSCPSGTLPIEILNSSFLRNGPSYNGLISATGPSITMTGGEVTGNMAPGGNLILLNAYCGDEAASFQEVSFTGNSGYYLIQAPSLEIADCLFESNQGQIYTSYYFNSSIINSIFVDSDIEIQIYPSSTATNVSGNIFSNNGSINSSERLLECLDPSGTTSKNIFAYQDETTVKAAGTIEKNIFYSNGICASNLGSGGGTIRDNAFIGNTAAFGAAVKLDDPGSVLMQRNVFMRNQPSDAEEGSVIGFTASSGPSGSPAYTASNNNFLANSARYLLRYGVTVTHPEMNAGSNYWGTTNSAAIDDLIFDLIDDATTQSVNFSPILTLPSTLPPVSPVQGLTVTPNGTNGFNFTWSANPEADIAGYRFYTLSSQDLVQEVIDGNMTSTDLGNVSSHSVTGLGAGTYYFTVTAYDSSYDAQLEDPDTIVPDNIMEGNESWYAEAKVASTEPNQAPVLAAIGNKQVDYDTLLEFTVSATDGNAGDVLTYTTSTLPSGATFNDQTQIFSWTPTAVQEGSYPITFTVTDTFGPAEDFETITITVLGPDVTAPVITIPGQNPLTIGCGGAFVPPNVTATDDRDGDLTSSIITSGDTVNTAAPNVYVITYDVSDSAGNPAATENLVVNVVDATLPTVTIVGSNPLAIALFGSYTEFGATASDTCSGDLTSQIQISGADTIDVATPGNYPVTYSATDSSNNTGQAVRNVIVFNSAPVLGEIGPKTITVGQQLSFTVVATDPNAAGGDTLTLTADPLPGNAAFDTLTATSSQFTWTPEEADFGSFDVTFTVTDAPGDSDSEVVTITVEPDTANAIFGTVREVGSGLPLANVAVSLQEQGGAYTDSDTTDANGNYLLDGPAVGGAVNVSFTLATYQPRNVLGVVAPRRLDVNLSSTIPAAPTGLIGLAGAGGNTLRWEANTETDLAGYNVYVSEEGGPFVKLNNTPVTDVEYVHAGLTSGNVYTYQITAVDTDDNESPPSSQVEVEAGRIEVFVPRVSAPTGTEVRIPINVNNAAGINPQGIDIDFRYPAAFLGGAGVSDVRLERTALTRQVVPLSNVTEAGRVRISSIGEAQTLVGEGHIFNIYLTLAEGIDGQCALMELADVKFFDDSVPPQALSVDFSTAADLCGDVACVQGDLNGDFDVNSADVLIALQVSVGLITPTPCQLQASDLNGDRVINSADALMIQRLAVGLPLNPPQAGEKGIDEYRPKGALRTVQVASVNGTPGDLVQVPISIDDAEGVTGMNLTVAFPGDPSQLTLESVQSGALTTGFTRQQNLGAGFAKFGFSTALPLSAAGGDIVLLNFRVSATAQQGTEYPVTLNEVRLNGAFGDNFSWTESIDRVDGIVTAGQGGEGSPDGTVDGEGSTDGELPLDTPAGLLSRFVEVDTNDDGEISLAEASTAGLEINAFVGLDTNSSGRIEVFELIEALAGEASIHRGDLNADGRFDLTEMLRIIQLYNAGAYVCDSNGEDGYSVAAPGSGLDGGCLPHAADYSPKDGSISLSELLRLIQFFNLGGYTFCKGSTEDDFCAP